MDNATQADREWFRRIRRAFKLQVIDAILSDDIPRAMELLAWYGEYAAAVAEVR